MNKKFHRNIIFKNPVIDPMKIIEESLTHHNSDIKIVIEFF